MSMNAPDMGVIGDWVIKGMPGVLWLIVLAHYFRVWDVIIEKLGLDSYLNFSIHCIEGL